MSQNTRPDRKVQRQDEAKDRQARWDRMNEFEHKADHERQGFRYDPPHAK